MKRQANQLRAHARACRRVAMASNAFAKRANEARSLSEGIAREMSRNDRSQRAELERIYQILANAGAQGIGEPVNVNFMGDSVESGGGPLFYERPAITLHEYAERYLTPSACAGNAQSTFETLKILPTWAIETFVEQNELSMKTLVSCRFTRSDQSDSSEYVYAYSDSMLASYGGKDLEELVETTVRRVIKAAHRDATAKAGRHIQQGKKRA